MKPAQFKYRKGDTFTAPAPSLCRFRVREIEKLPHWKEPQYTLQLYTVTDYKADPNGFSWHNRDHDRHFTDDQIEYFGLVLASRGDFVQMELF
jgi:hypothetical protein